MNKHFWIGSPEDRTPKAVEWVVTFGLGTRGKKKIHQKSRVKL